MILTYLLALCLLDRHNLLGNFIQIQLGSRHNQSFTAAAIHDWIYLEIISWSVLWLYLQHFTIYSQFIHSLFREKGNDQVTLSRPYHRAKVYV